MFDHVTVHFQNFTLSSWADEHDLHTQGFRIVDVLPAFFSLRKEPTDGRSRNHCCNTHALTISMKKGLDLGLLLEEVVEMS